MGRDLTKGIDYTNQDKPENVMPFSLKSLPYNIGNLLWFQLCAVCFIQCLPFISVFSFLFLGV
jgi:hypothetical protein